jgi:hypothetical protein
MSNPAVVILTDPAGCQLADAETLMQALLQVQQLNEAGVPASQAFCDHPAAAMEFIEAYSKAYPALQLETAELPLPQHLYSMVTDGRLSPLPPNFTAEAAKLEQGGQHSPLYVLSLGAPEALMQALQHNNLAKSSIRVLEVAPIEQVRAEPVSVAEAVAAEPLARSSWLAESSSTLQPDDRGASSMEPLADEPVELTSIEVDLDRIQIDTVRDRQAHDQNDRVHDEHTSAVIGNGVTGPGPSPWGLAGPGPNPSDVGPQTTAEAPASSIGIPDPSSPPAAPATLPSEPVADTPPAAPTDLSGTSITQSDVPPVVAESPSDDCAEAPEEPAPNEMEPNDPPIGDPSEQDPTTGHDASTPPPPGPAEGEPDIDDAAAASPSTPEADDESPPAAHECVFADPGEDVLYQPTSSFSGNDDLAYALPTDDAGEPSFFTLLSGFSESAEVIDLEAMYRDLSEPAAEGGAALKEFDFILLRAPNSDGPDPYHAPAAHSQGEELATEPNPEPNEDEALDNSLTTVHNADM